MLFCKGGCVPPFCYWPPVGVGMDEWVAYEYAKVKRFYTFLGIPERTTIEFFNGPHEINATGTFRFLHEQLNWPERKATP